MAADFAMWRGRDGDRGGTDQLRRLVGHEGPTLQEGRSDSFLRFAVFGLECRLSRFYVGWQHVTPSVGRALFIGGAAGGLL